MFLRRVADDPAAHALAHEAARPTALQRRDVDVVPELVDLFAEVVHRVDTLFAVNVAAERPTRVERIEGALDEQLSAVAVARVAERRTQPHAAAEHVAVGVAERRMIAIDLLLMRDLERLAGAEQVAVREPDAPFGFAALMVELEVER